MKNIILLFAIFFSFMTYSAVTDTNSNTVNDSNKDSTAQTVKLKGKTLDLILDKLKIMGMGDGPGIDSGGG